MPDRRGRPNEFDAYMARARARFVKGEGITEHEIRLTYQRAAERIRRQIETLAPGPSLRRTHLADLAATLEAEARRINQDVVNAIRAGIRLSVGAAISGVADWTMHATEGMFDVQAVREMFANVNDRATAAILYRTREGMMLSPALWGRAGDTASLAVKRLVEEGIAAGTDAKTLARDVQRYLDPSKRHPYQASTRRLLRVPKDVSYEAHRLARTELNNAFREGTVVGNRAAPSYIGSFWRLSGRHPKPDLCNTYAERGVYPPGEEPTAPHPNCLCRLEPAHEPAAVTASRLREWSENPTASPKAEEWYQKNAKTFLGRPTVPFDVDIPEPIIDSTDRLLEKRDELVQALSRSGVNVQLGTAERTPGGGIELVNLPKDEDAIRVMQSYSTALDRYEKLGIAPGTEFRFRSSSTKPAFRFGERLVIEDNPRYVFSYVQTTQIGNTVKVATNRYNDAAAEWLERRQMIDAGFTPLSVVSDEAGELTLALAKQLAQTMKLADERAWTEAIRTVRNSGVPTWSPIDLNRGGIYYDEFFAQSVARIAGAGDQPFDGPAFDLATKALVGLAKKRRVAVKKPVAEMGGLKPLDRADLDADEAWARVIEWGNADEGARAITALETEIAQLTSEYEALRSQWTRISYGSAHPVTGRVISDPDDLTDAIRSLNVKLNDTHAQIKAAEARVVQTRSEALEKLRRDVLYQPIPAQNIEVQFPTGGKLSKEGKAEWLKGIEGFFRLIGSGHIDGAKVGVVKLRAESRAYYINSKIHVTDGGFYGRSATVVHEMGHWLEELSSKAAKARQAYLAQRTAGEPVQKLSTLFPGHGYRSNEVAKPDRFLKPYAGKQYGPDGELTTNGRLSEMISMHVEWLYDDPLKLARDDPEGFRWIYNLLRKEKIVT